MTFIVVDGSGEQVGRTFNDYIEANKYRTRLQRRRNGDYEVRQQ